MVGLHIVLLGGIEARGSGGQLVRLPGQTPPALLAYLAMRPGRSHTRDELCLLLWPEVPASPARHRLRQTLLVLRRTLAAICPSWLLEIGESISVDPISVDVDVAAFEAAWAEGTPDALERASALYRGDFLAGLGRQAGPFEDWLLTERERLRELGIEASGRLLAHQLKAQSDGPAIRTASRLLSLDPAQEAVHRTLMRLYARQGRYGAALRQYQSCVAALRRDLGVEPEPETRRLYQELLRERPERRGQETAGEVATTAVVAESFLGVTDTPFVGRESERDQLRRDLEAAWSGSGRIAIVRGDAGIGKSRLVAEVIRDAIDHEGRVILGRAHASHQILPAAAWIEALRAAGVLEEIGRDIRVSVVVRRELARLFPELGRVSASTSGDYGRLFEALASLFVELARRQLVLVIVEDLQWADEMTLRLFAFLSQRLRSHRVLLLTTVREEDVATTPMLSSVLEELQRDALTTMIRLDPLSRQHVDTLVAMLMSSGPMSDRARLVERLWSTSQGNPFVLVELVRVLRAGVDPSDGPTLPLPERVREAIASRLGQLGERERHVLSAAAVLGRAMEFPLLQRVAGLDEREATEAVEQLVARRVLHAVGDQLDFVHDRVRDVAYGRLLPSRRAVLNEAAGQALEERYADRLDQVADRLAFHYSQTNRAEKSVTYLVRLAESAARAYSHVNAATALQEALGHLERLPTGTSRDRTRLDVVLRLAHAYYFLGRFREGVDLLLRESDRVSALGDPRLASPYHFWLAFLSTRLNEHKRTVESAQRAVDEGERCGDTATVGKAYGLLGVEAYWAGECQQSLEYGRKGVALLERTGERWWLGLGYFNLGMAYLHMGQFEEALEAEARVGIIAAELADPRLESYGLGVTGWIHAARGDTENAVEECRRALASVPDLVGRTYGSGSLGYAYVEHGDHVQAIPYLRQAIEGTSRFGARQFEGWYTVVLAEAFRLSGHAESARDAAHKGLRLAREAGNRYAVGWAQRTLARIARAEGVLGEARAGLMDALATLEAAHADFEAARTRLDLAEVMATQGDLGAAGRHLSGLAERFMTSGAPRYARHVATLAAQLGLSFAGGA